MYNLSVTGTSHTWFRTLYSEHYKKCFVYTRSYYQFPTRYTCTHIDSIEGSKIMVAVSEVEENIFQVAFHVAALPEQ